MTSRAEDEGPNGSFSEADIAQMHLVLEEELLAATAATQPRWKKTSGRVTLPSGDPLTLPDFIEHPNISLFEALALRRTERDVWAPLSASDLASVLRLSLARRKDGRLPFPTSGNQQALLALVLPLAVGGVDPVAHWWDSESHRLLRENESEGWSRRVACVASRSIGLAPDVLPASIIMLVADLARLRVKYEGPVLPSAWLDAGACLQTISLAATAVGIPSAVVGQSLVAEMSELTGVPSRDLAQVGAICLGGRLDLDAATGTR